MPAVEEQKFLADVFGQVVGKEAMHHMPGLQHFEAV